MKIVLVLAALAAVAVARPQEQLKPGVIPILNSQYTRDDFGQFALSYLTGDGTRVSEQGALVPNAENTGHVLIKQGSYSYYAPDGSEVKLDWQADDKGFRAVGDHLPTTPASPPAASL